MTNHMTTRTFSYEDEKGVTEGRNVFLSDEESSVLGPDGEPLRKTRRAKLGFDLRTLQTKSSK